jgi:hypothetical protein
MVIGSTVVGVLVGVSLWSYILNPNWLSESHADSPWIDRILRLNPTLSREDLEKDAELGDLSFWFGRSESSYTGAPPASPPEEGEQEPSLLEQFMKQQEADNAQQNAANPLLTPPTPADNATPATTAQPDQPPPRSALDRALNGESPTAEPTTNPLQTALEQQGNATDGPGAATPANAAPTPQTSRYDNANNLGIPDNSAASSSSVPAVPPTRTRRNTPTTPTAIPALPPTGRRTVPTNPLPGNPTTATPQAPNVPSNQRRQLTPNAGAQQGFQRVGGGDINTFADPLNSTP